MKKIRSAAVSISAVLSAIVCAAISVTIVGMMAATPAQAQSAPGAAPASTAAEASTAKIHGHAQTPLSQPISDAKVELSTDGKTPIYTFTTDANGDYTGAGIKPGNYAVVLKGKTTDSAGKTTEGIIDFQPNVKFTAGVDTAVDFDLTRAAYISKLSPEMQKEIAKAQKENATAQKENVQIKNVNKLITDARAARAAGNFDQAIALDTQATVGKPDSGLTWYELGSSNLGAKKYDAAVANYKKSLEIMGTEKTPKPEVLAAAYNNLGEALAHSGKTSDAVAAYESAAKADPTQAAKYYGNAAIVLFKTGSGDAAGAAADKAIAADPNQPIPYYIKGWSLVQHATIDPKTNKIVLPAGCADAYHKFLSLESTGPLADEARSILQQAGETVHSSFKKKR